MHKCIEIGTFGLSRPNIHFSSHVKGLVDCVFVKVVFLEHAKSANFDAFGLKTVRIVARRDKRTVRQCENPLSFACAGLTGVLTGESKKGVTECHVDV